MIFTIGSSLYSLVIITHISMLLRSIKVGNRLFNLSANTSSITLACSRNGNIWLCNWVEETSKIANSSCFIANSFMGLKISVHVYNLDFLVLKKPSQLRRLCIVLDIKMIMLSLPQFFCHPIQETIPYRY